MGPEKPSCMARSGVTTPMFTVRCFQMRLSVSRVSYSSMQAGKRFTKSAMKSSRPPERRSLRRSTSFLLRHSECWYLGMDSGRSRYTPPGL